jgi:hypothetical protein
MLCITRNIELSATRRGGPAGAFAWSQAVQLSVAMYTQIQMNAHIRFWSPMAGRGVFESKQEGNEWLV